MVESKKNRRSIAATYDYRDEVGTPLFQVVRFDPKGFAQRHLAEDGRWKWGAKGRRKVLYRLPELLASSADQAVFFPEGEKDVEGLIPLGFVATCNPGGAGKFTAAMRKPLKGHPVVIIADKDEAGHKHAQQVAGLLFGFAASVKILELPGDGINDFSDWLAAGGSRQELIELVESNLEWDPSVSADVRGAGLDLDESSSAADRATSYVLESRAELFHDEHDDPFIAFKNKQARMEVRPLRSRVATNYIRWCFFQQEGKGLSGQSLATAQGTLASLAMFQGSRRPLSLRVANHQGALWYDLGDWRVVRIDTEGWEVVEHPPILFLHYNHQSPHVEPQRGGSLDTVLNLFNVQDIKSRLLLKVYLVAGLLPEIPLPLLLVHGEQGSAKSFLLKILRALLDPSSLGTVAPPENLREFVQEAAHHRTLYLDNLSHLPDWMSDALCRLCTGEGFSKRELYTDDDDVIYNFRRLGAISGINLVVSKPDLLDRGIILKLNPIAEEDRKEEIAVWAEFHQMRPFLLGAMFDTLSEAMRRYPEVKLFRMPRLADFARWGYAIAQALGHNGEEFLDAYGLNVASQNDAALEESLVAQAVLARIEEGQEWDGTASELLVDLESHAEKLHLNIKARGWPKAANVLSKRLRDVTPNLRRAGIDISERRVRGVTRWSICCLDREDTAPIATIASGVAIPATPHLESAPPPTRSVSPPDAASPPPSDPEIQYAGGDGGDGGDLFPATDGLEEPPAGQDRLRLSL